MVIPKMFSILNAIVFLIAVIAILSSIEREENSRDEFTIQSLFFKFAIGLMIIWFCVVGVVYCIKDLTKFMSSLWMFFWNFL